MPRRHRRGRAVGGRRLAFCGSADSLATGSGIAVTREEGIEVLLAARDEGEASGRRGILREEAAEARVELLVLGRHEVQAASPRRSISAPSSSDGKRRRPLGVNRTGTRTPARQRRWIMVTLTPRAFAAWRVVKSLRSGAIVGIELVMPGRVRLPGRSISRRTGWPASGDASWAGGRGSRLDPRCCPPESARQLAGSAE